MSSAVWRRRAWRSASPLVSTLPCATPARAGQLVGGDAATNASYARAVLAGERGPHRDLIVLNAAAGLVVGGAVTTMPDGVALAGAVLDDGRAATALERLVAASQANA